MSVIWGGSYRSQRPPVARWRQSPTFRRVALYAADRAVPLFTNRRRPVELSEWRGALDALRQFHKIAADARPPSGVVSKQVASAALSSRLPVGIGQGASCPQAAAMPPALLGLDRSEVET